MVKHTTGITSPLILKVLLMMHLRERMTWLFVDHRREVTDVHVYALNLMKVKLNIKCELWGNNIRDQHPEVSVMGDE